MTFNELNAIIEASNEKAQDEWERTRTICSFILASFSTEKTDIKKIMPFEWDYIENENVIILDENEKNELKNKMENIDFSKIEINKEKNIII